MHKQLNSWSLLSDSAVVSDRTGGVNGGGGGEFGSWPSCVRVFAQQVGGR